MLFLMNGVGELARALLSMHPGEPEPGSYLCVNGELRLEYKTEQPSLLWRLLGDFAIHRDTSRQYTVYQGTDLSHLLGKEVSAFHLDVKSGVWLLNSRGVSAAHALLPKTYISLEGKVISHTFVPDEKYERMSNVYRLPKTS